MVNAVSVFHFLIAIGLIGLILIQDPKGGSAGMFGGGGSNSVFGATGAPTILNRLTTWLAVAFAVTSIGLTMLMRGPRGSVIDQVPAASLPAAPVTTGSQAAPQGGGQPNQTAPLEVSPTGKLGEVPAANQNNAQPAQQPANPAAGPQAPATPGSSSR